MSPFVRNAVLHRLDARSLAGVLVVTGALLLSACAAGPGVHHGPTTYDFGPPPVSAAATGARPTIAVSDVLAPDWMDNPALYYRLNFSDAQQPRPYADSRWAMAPAQLVTHRLKARLARNANVVAAGDTLEGVLLKVELDEFAQVFDSANVSHSSVQMRASLIRNGRLLGQRSFAVERAAASADAAGGVKALTQASDALLDALADWTLATLK